jgi:hypothetical protein
LLSGTVFSHLAAVGVAGGDAAGVVVAAADLPVEGVVAIEGGVGEKCRQEQEGGLCSFMSDLSQGADLSMNHGCPIFACYFHHTLLIASLSAQVPLNVS